MATEETEEQNLVDELSKGKAGQGPPMPEETSRQKENQAGPRPASPKPVDVDFDDIPDDEPLNETEPEVKKEPAIALSPKQNAEIMVLTGGALMTTVFRFLFKRRKKALFKGKEAEIVRAKELLETGNEKNMTDEQVTLLARYQLMDERSEKIPLTTDEETRLIKVVSAYCQKNNIQMPPGFAMAAVVGEILLDRVSTIYQE